MKTSLAKKYILAIKAIAIAHIVLGVLLPFLAQIEMIEKLLVDTMFNNIALSGEAHAQAAYVISLFGPTVASWGMLLFILIQNYSQQPTQKIWLGLVAAILVWYIGDTSYSLLNNVGAAFVLNTLVTACLLIPLWQIRSLNNKN